MFANITDEEQDHVTEAVNEIIRGVVPEFDLRQSYYFWARDNRKFTVAEKRQVRALLEPELKDNWKRDYRTYLIFSTLANMGFKDLDVTALVDRFVAIGDSQAKMHFDERDFIANMLLLCVHPSNFAAYDRFFRVEGIWNESLQSMVLGYALKIKAFREDPRFDWLADDPRFPWLVNDPRYAQRSAS